MGKRSRLEIQPYDQWIRPTADGFDVRNPVTLEPLDETPAYADRLDSAQAFWKEYGNDIYIETRVSGGDPQTDALPPDEPSDFDIYGGFVPFDQNPENGYQSAVRFRLLRNNMAAFCVMSASQGRLTPLVTDLGFRSLDPGADEVFAKQSSWFETTNAERNKYTVLNTVSVLAVEGWAAAEHITASIQALRAKNGRQVDPTKVLMDIDFQQAQVPAALLALGANQSYLSPNTTGPVGEAIYNVLPAVQDTGTITWEQLKKLQAVEDARHQTAK